MNAENAFSFAHQDFGEESDSSSHPGACFKKEYILLVDDDRFYRTVFVRSSQARGIAALSFASAAELKHRGPIANCKALVVDYYLNHENGSDLLEYAREINDNVPFFLISADPKIKDVARKSGAIFLDKTIGVGPIISQIATTIHES